MATDSKTAFENCACSPTEAACCSSYCKTEGCLRWDMKGIGHIFNTDYIWLMKEIGICNNFLKE